MNLDDIIVGENYYLAYRMRGPNGERCHTTFTAPLLLTLATYERGQPLELRFWSKYTGSFDVCWFNVVRMERSYENVRIVD